MTWHLYILDCDGRCYTGIATDPRRRLNEHREGKRRAARFTRAARKIEMLYSVELGERGLALRAEARLKKLPRAEKLAIVREQPPGNALLERLGLHAERPASAA